jgi:hypothetical protein
VGYPHKKNTILICNVQKYYHFPSGHLCSGANTTAGKKQLHFAHLNRRGEIDFGTMVCLSSGHSLQIRDLSFIFSLKSGEGEEMFK